MCAAILKILLWLAVLAIAGLGEDLSHLFDPIKDSYNCTTFCYLPFTTEVVYDNTIARVLLPKTFRLYFEYNIQFWFGPEANLFEIQCGGKTVFRMNIQFPNIAKPYLDGELVADFNPKVQAPEFAVQPEEQLPTRKKKERYYNPMIVEFQETVLHFSGFEFHQEKYIGGVQLQKWGQCEFLASTNRNFQPVPDARIRNIQIRGIFTVLHQFCSVPVTARCVSKEFLKRLFEVSTERRCSFPLEKLLALVKKLLALVKKLLVEKRYWKPLERSPGAFR